MKLIDRMKREKASDWIVEPSNMEFEVLSGCSMKKGTTAKSFSESVEKFNPYHDKLGRFATAGGASATTAQESSGKGTGKKKVDKQITIMEADFSRQDAVDYLIKHGKDADYITESDIDRAKANLVEEKKVAMVADYGNLSQEKAEEVTAVLKEWCSGDYQNCSTKTIDSYIESAPAYDGETYRGLRFDSHSDYDAFLSNIKEGAIIGSRNMNVSWTSYKDVADGFIHRDDESGNYCGVMLTCTKNKTSTPIGFMSDFNEAEVLAHSSSKWKVVGYSVDGNMANVFVEEV